MVNGELQPIHPEVKKENLISDISPEKKDLTQLQTKIETSNLKNEVIDTVEVTPKRAYEVMKESKMHDKLLTVLWSENKVETFALNIDKVVRKYLDQELDGFSNNIKNSMSVGIQFAMMETLAKQWADWSAEFFEAFSTTKSKSSGKAFEWLYNSFGKLWSANEFFVLANKVQNLTWYLSDKKNIIIGSKNIPELMNPHQFKLLLNKPVRSNQAQIDTLDIANVLTLNSSTAFDVHAWEDEFKKIVNSDKISDVITEKTITAIQKSLKTADSLLDTRGKFKDKASELIDKIAGFLDINIPFFGNLGEMVDMKFPTDILGEKKDGGVMNFVLWVLGFRGGLSWLHKEYIKEKLDELNIDNAFVAAAYTDFQKNADVAITNDSPTSTWKTCWLVASDTTKEAIIKAKIPADYAGLKKSLVDNIDTATLNPAIVNAFANYAIVSDDTGEHVDIHKITDKNAFVDQYLMYIIPLLADPSDDFILSKNIDKNSFALAVMGGLVGDKYFIEGVNIGLLSPVNFVTTTKTPSDLTDGNDTTYHPETITTISTKKEFIGYIKNTIIAWESAWKYDSVNPYDVNGVSLWLLQWHKDRAKDLLVKMQTSYPTEFSTIMGDEFKDLSNNILWTTQRDTGKITKFQTLMQDEKFQKIMDDFTETDIQRYITNAVNEGINDPAMIAYYCYMQNAWTGWAKNLLKWLSLQDFKSLHAKLLSSSYIKRWPAIGKKYEALYADLMTKDFSVLDKNLA